MHTSFHISILSLVVRLFALMFIVIIGFFTGFIYIAMPIGMVVLVTALSGYCPIEAYFHTKNNK